jgi:urease accessory protein
MQRASSIRHAGAFAPDRIIDIVVLEAGDRTRRRIVLTGGRGTSFLLDLAQPVALRDGDGIVLDDGSVVMVAGAAEPLAEFATEAPLDLVRLAWHLGNRHADVQIAGDRLRIRRDHVLEEMAAGLGAAVTPIEAPFDPEPGASHDRGREHDHGA